MSTGPGDEKRTPARRSESDSPPGFIEELVAPVVDPLTDALEEVAIANRLQAHETRIADLNESVRDLQQIVATVAGLELVGRALEHGFKELGTQLQPLRHLVPQSQALTPADDVPARIEGLRLATDRADFRQIAAIKIDVGDVPFVGGTLLTDRGRGKAS